MYMYLCISFFHGNHERREMCACVQQVLNGVCDGALCSCIYAFMCVQVYV